MNITDHLNNILEGYATLTLICTVICVYVVYLWQSYKDFPRGPWGVPLWGFGPFMSDYPYKDFVKLSEKYGDIFSVRLGTRDLVILNHYDVFKEAFIKHGEIFTGRPQDGIEGEFGEHKSIFATEGKLWKDIRRFLLSSLRDFGFGKNIMEQHVQDEVQIAIENLRKYKGKPLELDDIFSYISCNTISYLLFGKRFTNDEKEVFETLQYFNQLNIQNFFYSPITIFPFLFKFLPLKLLAKDIFKRRNKMYEFIDKMKKEHEETFDENNLRDLLDVYLMKQHQMKEKGEKADGTIYSDDFIKPNFVILFAAGSDTTATTLEWAVKILAENPDLQAQLQQEIDEIVGRNRLPCMNDRLKMPYMEAFLLEIHRYATVAPMVFDRRPIRDVTLRGYKIPKDSFIYGNIWSIHNDPNIWKEPETFNIQRFIGADGKINNLREYVVPFAIGKRNCLGESLAKMEIFIVLTSLLKNFVFKPPNGTKLTFECSSLSLRKLNSCILCAESRD